MANVGIVLRPNLEAFGVISTYYASAPHEPTKKGTLPIDRVATYRPDFLSLLQMIAAVRRSHVVVVSHGSAYDGLILDIAPEVRQVCSVCFPDLRRLVENWEQSGSLDLTAAREFSSKWKLRPDTGTLLAKACHTIRNTPEICVALHIRGCDIGRDPENLRAIQQLLGCAVVSAPKCAMLYTIVRPVPGDTASFAQRAVLGRRRTFEDREAGRLILDLEKIGVKASSHAASAAAIGKWARILLENPRAQTPHGAFAVSALYPFDVPGYYLAHDPQYVDYLEAVRNA